MTKTEIIELIACADVPEGTMLEERIIPGPAGFPRLKVSCFGAGRDNSGLKLVEARMLAEQLKAATSDLSETPDARLLGRLHQTAIDLHQEVIDSFTIVIEYLGQGVIETHRKVIERLRRISRDIGVPYKEPPDHLLGPRD